MRQGRRAQTRRERASLDGREMLTSVYDQALEHALHHPTTGCRALQNSPPCTCDSRDALWRNFTAGGGAAAAPLPLALRASKPDAPHLTKVFPAWSYKAGYPRGCSRYALDLSGGYAGLGGLEALERMLVAGSDNVAVFAHMLVSSDNATSVGRYLRGVFGRALCAASVETYSPELHAHVQRAGGNALQWLDVNCAGKSSGGKRQLARTISMWRNVFVASQLRLQHEMAAGCEHAVVVRARPDLILAERLDWRQFALESGHVVHLGCHGGGPQDHSGSSWRVCEERATRWPAGACWADDQYAVGPAGAMGVYERLFADLERFAWWFPLGVRTSGRNPCGNFPERLLLAHLDWRAKAAADGASPPFGWDVRSPAASGEKWGGRLGGASFPRFIGLDRSHRTKCAGRGRGCF